MKEGGCGWRRCIKGLLVSFNVCFWLSGPTVLGLGIWLKVSLQEVEPLIEYAQYALPVWLLIGSGTAVIVFGGIGCIAVFNEHKSLLGLYFMCLLAVFAAEFGSCLQYFLEYEQFSCCGADNWTDWRSTLYFRDGRGHEGLGTSLPFPGSCCIRRDLCNRTVIANYHHEIVFKQGCVVPVVSHIKRIVRIVGWSSFATSVMQWVGGILIYCLRSAID